MLILTFTSSAQTLNNHVRIYADLKDSGYIAISLNKDTALAAHYFNKATNYYVDNIKYGYCDALNLAVLFNSYVGNDLITYNLIMLKIIQNSENVDEKMLNSILNNRSYPAKTFRHSKYYEKLLIEAPRIQDSVNCLLNHELISEYVSLHRLDNYNRNVLYEKRKSSKEKDSVLSNIYLNMFNPSCS